MNIPKKLSIYFFSLFLLPFVFINNLCNLPSNPDNPANTTLSLILETSDFQKSDSSVTDTVGKTIRIGLCLGVKKYIDSISVTFGTSNKIDTVIELRKIDIKKDTIHYEMVFSDAGTRTVSAIAYVGDEFRKESVKIHIIARPVPNRKPTLTISGEKEVVAGERCTLFVSVDDPDSGQTLTVSLSGNPDGSHLTSDNLFVWETPETFSGDTTIFFIVKDNGTPPLSDTEEVIISVSNLSGNAAPQWSVEAVPLNIHSNELCTLELGNICEDPDGDELTFTLVDGEPSGDTITEEIYRFTPTDTSAGSYSVKIVASDPDGETDTLSVELTVDTSKTDTTAPAITVISPSDNTAVSSATIEIEVICSDASGIKKVTASTSDSTLELAKQDDHYKGAIDLVDGSNTITITATDASPSENTEIKQISVIYSPTFTITYEGNEHTSGKVPTDTSRYEKGEPVMVSENTGNLVKTGSVFAGWNTNADGSGTGYAAGDTFSMPGTDVELFAQWDTLPTYKITYDANNADSGTVPVDSNSYYLGKEVTVAGNPGGLYRDGYLFSGWNIKADGFGESYNAGSKLPMPDSAITLYVKWTTNPTYSIIYHSNGNTGGVVPATVTADSGTTVSIADSGSLYKTGYSFVGWNAEEDGSGKAYVAGDKTVIGVVDIDLYAQWTKEQYVLTYHGNGHTSGTVPPKTTRLYQTIIPVTGAGDLARTGYTFIGWNTDAAGNGLDYQDGDSIVLEKDTDLFARWIKNVYKITFFENGDMTSDVPDVTDFEYGMKIDSTDVVPTRQGYQFNGWFKDSLGNDNWEYGMDSVTSSDTLYANWFIQDIDGNIYTDVRIGEQVWMVENLKVTHYNDGTDIPFVPDSASWASLSTPGYCWYDNNEEENKPRYGALYNWYSISTDKLAPEGWHVPSDDEWTALVTFLGGADDAGADLKESGIQRWSGPNIGATNASGFTALPGGYRLFDMGRVAYWGKNLNGFWWSSTAVFEGASAAHDRNLGYDRISIYDANSPKKWGMSVRCVRDY